MAINRFSKYRRRRVSSLPPRISSGPVAHHFHLSSFSRVASDTGSHRDSLNLVRPGAIPYSSASLYHHRPGEQRCKEELPVYLVNNTIFYLNLLRQEVHRYIS
ncbi:hypothetical protein GYMLUDRAFT_696601 [Collybiopsis luxurians FD-317 M1]|uniref:Uncharacterized protein n=1 Tax=Collybiopsis luxurians FD-317 M1 TaxID=944289 RepID=A0A0D0B550_9AGAR|nr:hypothetical protein GYMLUDRAFT_696601 [Collybiopsis luxurians FD-317 M1]